MASIIVTKSLARMMLRLQHSGVILKRKARYENPPIRYRQDASILQSRHGDDIGVSEQLFEQLRKAKLIEEMPHHRYSFPVKKAFRLTEAGKVFHIPPEKFWVEDPE